MDNNMDRMQLMKEIGEASFMVNDLTLYLDTHPTDQEALKAFSEASKKRRELMEICAPDAQYDGPTWLPQLSEALSTYDPG